MSQTDKLVMMANQIARNFEILGDDEAKAKTAEHIVKFWDPRMRAAMAAHLATGGDGLTPIARAAAQSVAA